MKTLHKLKEKVNFINNDFYVFDTETNGLRAKPDAFIFGVVYGYSYTKVIYSVEDFKKEFENERYRNKKVFAHHAEYDLNVIYENIYNLDNKAIFNGKFISASNGNCFFADSLNILLTSVKKIGTILGIEKKEIEHEYTLGEVKEITKKMIDYCIRDCQIVFDALCLIFEMVGSVRITLAGLSMDYYRRKFQPFHLDYNEKLCEYFFKSYYGGRTEAFKIGKTTAYAIDINSMYPYAMREAVFPNPKNLKHITNICKDIFIKKYLYDYEGCALLKVKHKESYFGFLPYRKDNKLIFPTGTFEGWYNLNELRFAIDNNMVEIIEVNELIFGNKMKSPLIDYVDFNYKKRQETDNEFYRYFYKIMLNSLYGKFGQKLNTEYIYIHNIEEQIEEIQKYQLNKTLIKIIPFNSDRVDCFIEVKSKKNELLYNSIPLISSYITSYARVYLLKYLLKYYGNIPVYCDTDSIFLEKLPEIKNNNNLGGWKIENKLITEVRGLKNYSYIYNEINYDKIKGVPKNAKKIEKNKFIYKSLVKTREALARNIEVGIQVEREKILSGKYDKRIVLNNGETLAIKL